MLFSKKFLSILIIIMAINIVNMSSAVANRSNIAPNMFHVFTQAGSQITASDIKHAQDQWAAGIIAIGKAYSKKGHYKQLATRMVNQLYAYNYGSGIVLFKPTKAEQRPFRNTAQGALSYFIGGNSSFKEDKGFALEPWVNIQFNNNAMYFYKQMAIAMGEYTFTSINGDKVKVLYTFGYIKTTSGQLKIILHHSSLNGSH